MSERKWKFANADKQQAHLLAEECMIEPLDALLLLSRGISDPVEVDEFLSAEDFEFESPFLLDGTDKAVARIEKAIDELECIAVFGDYDADGITSSAILYTYLSGRGAKVLNYIPDRLSEGYGMNREAVKTLFEQGVKLIITVDNGISCCDEIAYAAELGMDTVVTDHHIPGGELPEAAAVVDAHTDLNPDGIYRDYAGVGVTLKLLCALERNDSSDFIAEYAALAAIGTVADIVPLTGENRAIVKLGLKKLNEECPVGISALLCAAGYSGKPLNSTALSFAVAPRINAAGRMGECEKAFSLVMCDDPEKAALLADEVEALNTKRKGVEGDIYSKACEIIDSGNISRLPVIVVGDDGWHDGVLGIVASRLVKRYGKPAVVFSYDGENARGSARSTGNFSIYDAVSAAADTVESFGGHKMALGISAKKSQIDDFIKAVTYYCKSICMPDAPELYIDCKLNPVGVSVQTAELIKGLEPFGQENPVPVFGLMNMKIEAVHPLSDGKHITLNVSRDGYAVRTVFFGMRLSDFGYNVGEYVDIAVNLESGAYKGKPSLSVMVRDIRPAGIDYDAFYSEYELCTAFFAGKELNGDEKKSIAPSRDEVGTVYKYLVRQSGYSGESDLLYKRCGIAGAGKLLLSLEILSQLGFISITKASSGSTIALNDIREKRPIEGSEIFRAVHGL